MQQPSRGQGTLTHPTTKGKHMSTLCYQGERRKNLPGKKKLVTSTRTDSGSGKGPAECSKLSAHSLKCSVAAKETSSMSSKQQGELKKKSLALGTN
eukprot:887004-Pelagomonas_calceolata.AAC.3